MYTFSEVKKKFLKNAPNWIIESPYVYNGLYVFVAHDSSPGMYSDCMFAADPDTGEYYSFTPFDDLEDFYENAKPIRQV